MRYDNDAKLTQHKCPSIRLLVGHMPTETGNLKEDVRNLRNYMEQLTVSLEYVLEHLTIEQFADGEIEKIGGGQNGETS